MKFFHPVYRSWEGRVSLGIVGILLGIYLLLFSAWGNRLMLPSVERALSSAFSTPVTIREFSLRHNRYRLVAHDDRNNTFASDGNFSLFDWRIKARYRMECPHSEGMNLLGTSYKADGNLSGGFSDLTVSGDANLFGGDMIYQVQLHRLHLSSLRLTLGDVGYEPLLHWLEFPSDTDTLLNGTIDLEGFERRDLNGSIRLMAKTRRFSPTPIKVNEEPFDLRAFLADEYGRIKPFDVNISLNASIEHLGILEQFTEISLKGSAHISALLHGDKEFLRLNAHTDAAKSDTSLMLEVPDLEPSKVVVEMKHADAEQLFSLFSSPAPVRGSISAKGHLTPSNALVNVSVDHGSTVPKVLKSVYHITQPLIRFDASLGADITSKGVHYRGMLRTDLKRMEIDSSTTHDAMLRELLKSLN
ncbi:MAG: hypothetical protein PHW64_01675 [Sulfuricurvum sp.]|nr:hypothetical protein [Sulfuricurvum sp.]